MTFKLAYKLKIPKPHEVRVMGNMLHSLGTVLLFPLALLFYYRRSLNWGSNQIVVFFLAVGCQALISTHVVMAVSMGGQKMGKTWMKDVRPFLYGTIIVCIGLITLKVAIWDTATAYQMGVSLRKQGGLLYAFWFLAVVLPWM